MRLAIFGATLLALATPLRADEDVAVQYVQVEVERPSTLSELDRPAETLGFDGAAFGLQDNITTGRFLGHRYTLTPHLVSSGDDLLTAARAALAESKFVLLDAPTDTLMAIADMPEAQDAVLFNARPCAASLRSEDCRANMLHSVPSTSMRTDALAQFFVKKRWDDLVMIAGTHPDDLAYADAMRGSLSKFGLRLGAEKTWAFDADMRRNAAQAASLFTQDLGAYDAMVTADEIGDLARYILYNTWVARLVTGSEGLSAQTWAPVVEQWGAIQLQNRFREDHDRLMAPKDYAAWAAMRAIGEAVTRTNQGEVGALRAFMLGPDFELAGFKGRPLTFRNWNGQLRQPIPLVHPRALVALAPREGFLHQRTELDTLGLDAPHSNCTAFEE